MSKCLKIDYAKLLGFETIGDHLTDEIDFRDETLAATVGAKVGTEPGAGPVRCLNYAKLLGFVTVSNELGSGLDFKNEIIGDKLGAKIGFEPSEPKRS
jgi:hypothetical protein